MKKTLLLGIALAVILVPGVMAQVSHGLDDTSVPSMKNTATGGLWGNDMDNAQDVNDYQDVEFDKFFAFLAGGNTGITGGFAKNFGKIYVGIYYTGNLVNGSSVERTDAAGNRNDSTPNDNGFTFTDNLYGLIGTPVGGFKLGILSDFRADKDTDEVTAAGTKTTTKTTDNDGRLGLGLIWGKNFDIGPGVLKPEIGILYGFNLEKNETTSSTVPSTPTGSSTTRSVGDYAPLQLLIQGDYVFPENGGRQSVISFSEFFDYHIFPDPRDESTTAGGSKTTVTRTGKEWDNTLSMGFKRTYGIDEKFSVAWNAEGVFFYSKSDEEAETEMTTASGTTNTAKTYGNTTTDIRLTPRARLGFTYQFVPDKFALHGHAGVELPFTRREVSSNVPNNKTSTTTTSWGGLTPFVGLGGTFQLHPMAVFDFSIQTGTTAVALTNNGFFTAAPNIQASVIVRN
jgi:hypothetical protein